LTSKTSSIDDPSRPISYGNVIAREPTTGSERLVVGPSQDAAGCLVRMASVLAGECHLLYVLHTTRTGAQLGRYQSSALNKAEYESFLQEFGRFLGEDSRHDVWLHSPSEGATIVLDRHNLIFGYGPLAAFERVLLEAGMCRGAVPRVPLPHLHHYHAQWDGHETAILGRLPWQVGPLHEEDRQWDSGEDAG